VVGLWKDDLAERLEVEGLGARTILRHLNGQDRTHDYPPRQLGDLRAAFGVRAVLAVAALRARRRPRTSLSPAGSPASLPARSA
jgi:hypothetical protein